ncbi:MAG: hypothetical protein ACRDBQ_12250, partial [Shewanella sp.]
MVSKAMQGNQSGVPLLKVKVGDIVAGHYTSDPITRRRGVQRWPLCPCYPRLHSICCLRLASRVITRLPDNNPVPFIRQ